MTPPKRMVAYDERECPECGQTARADFVDNGVGMQQCGPFGCEACGWVETAPDELADLGDDTFSDAIFDLK